MELPYIHNKLDKYEKIKPSSICILHSYSCKNRHRRVTVIKKKTEKDGWQTVITFILQRPNM